MRLIRLLFRLAATVCLAVAVIAAVGDATRSVAAGSLEATPLLVHWTEMAPRAFDVVEDAIAGNLGDGVWKQLFLPLLGLPGFVFFAVLAVVFYAAGRSPAPRRGRIATPA